MVMAEAAALVERYLRLPLVAAGRDLLVLVEMLLGQRKELRVLMAALLVVQQIQILVGLVAVGARQQGIRQRRLALQYLAEAAVEEAAVNLLFRAMSLARREANPARPCLTRQRVEAPQALAHSQVAVVCLGFVAPVVQEVPLTRLLLLQVQAAVSLAAGQVVADHPLQAVLQQQVEQVGAVSSS